MLLTIMAMAIASAASADPPVDKIELASDDRWALLTGLQRRLGGPFIMAGLDGADVDCTASKACISVDTLRTAVGTDRVAGVDSLGGLMGQVRVGDDRPVALVAMRAGRYLSRARIQVTVSVYSAQTKNWVLKDIVLGGNSYPVPNGPPRRTILRYDDSTLKI